MTSPWYGQQGGNHYTRFEIQPSQYIEANGLLWFEANVVKYISRHWDKGGLADLQKAIHYIQLRMFETYQHVPAEVTMVAELKEFYPDIYAELEASQSDHLDHIPLSLQETLAAPGPVIHVNPPDEREHQYVYPCVWGNGDPEPGTDTRFVKASNSQVFERVTVQRWRGTGPLKAEYYDKTMWRAGMGVEIEWPDLIKRMGSVIDCTREQK